MKYWNVILPKTDYTKYPTTYDIPPIIVHEYLYKQLRKKMRQQKILKSDELILTVAIHPFIL